MKRSIKKSAFLYLLCCLSIFAFLFYDYIGYEYGLGCFFCRKMLPFGIYPKVNRYDCIYLFDDDDFELVGGGFKYDDDGFKIKKFLGYGYNDSSIIVKYEDDLNDIHYLSSYRTGYRSDSGNPDISFKDMDKLDYLRRKKHYKWIDLDHDKVRKVRALKIYSFMGTVFFFFLSIWQWIINRREH